MKRRRRRERKKCRLFENTLVRNAWRWVFCMQSGQNDDEMMIINIVFHTIVFDVNDIGNGTWRKWIEKEHPMSAQVKNLFSLNLPLLPSLSPCPYATINNVRHVIVKFKWTQRLHSTRRKNTPHLASVTLFERHWPNNMNKIVKQRTKKKSRVPARTFYYYYYSVSGIVHLQ